jgi:hypothetical protein
MCPAHSLRLKKKAWKPQNQLRYKRTMSRLRTYDRRAKEYAAMKALVLAMFIFKFMSAIRAEREERWRVAGLPNRKMYMRRRRLAAKQRVREAKRQVKAAIEAKKLAATQAREAKRQWHLRKHATAHAGVLSAWGAAVPWTEAEMVAQSYAKRFITAYLETAKDKARLTAKMQKQQQTPTIQPRTIQL